PAAPYGSAYQYAANRPSVLIDPSGKTFVPCVEALTNARDTTSGSERSLAAEGGSPRPLSCGRVAVQLAGRQQFPDDPFIHVQARIIVFPPPERVIEAYSGVIEVTEPPLFDEGKEFRGFANPFADHIDV